MEPLLTVKETARRLRLSTGRVRQLLVARRIVGAVLRGSTWAIPAPIVINPPLSKRNRPLKFRSPSRGPRSVAAVSRTHALTAIENWPPR
jgi:hypothetical protein